MKSSQGRNRVVIEDIAPQLNAGRNPIRRIVGDRVVITAAVFADGHDHVAAHVLYRHKSEKAWRLARMKELGNDLWTASFTVDQKGCWNYAVQGWIDHFDTWVSDLRKRLAAQAGVSSPLSSQAVATQALDAQAGAGLDSGAIVSPPAAAPQDIPLALRTGAILLKQASGRARGLDAKRLNEASQQLSALADKNLAYYEFPLDEKLIALMAQYPDLALATRSELDLNIWVDRDRARFSSWYELFPRSASSIPGRHGTFADVERQLPEIAEMGFDILYMPPIHPIGRAFRKGPNNSTTAGPEDHGSPWAIGDAAAIVKTAATAKTDDGGHKSLHPQLGTWADFDSLVAAAKRNGMEIALDIAFQCSPDHPWVTQHPSWFVIRPDGSIQYAENPPKKYQDIYPLNFESPDWRGLWDELYSVFEFWIERGVLVFRVDNPHTKAMPFWEWCLNALRSKYPDVIFLAEAFTRPHVMYWLAKVGFTQSYTYFTWRTTQAELQEYLEEITQPPVSEFFRPNFWPNTPDILHKTLQEGGRAAFMQRVILAATLTANYGIYGPAYELCENAPAKPAPGKTESEEYLDSEKYEIRQRDRNAPGSLVPLITQLNQIRRAHPALQQNATLRFHATDNPQLICYSKTTPNFTDTILVAVNLDPVNDQSGWVDLDLAELRLLTGQTFIVEDLLSGARYPWHGQHNYVSLRPGVQPAHIFRILPQP